MASPSRPRRGNSAGDGEEKLGGAFLRPDAAETKNTNAVRRTRSVESPPPSVESPMPDVRTPSTVARPLSAPDEGRSTWAGDGRAGAAQKAARGGRKRPPNPNPSPSAAGLKDKSRMFQWNPSEKTGEGKVDTEIGYIALLSFSLRGPGGTLYPQPHTVSPRTIHGPTRAGKMLGPRGL